MSNAVIYARYSTDMQREASIEDQVRLCEARARSEGASVLQCYSDHGISGASLMRPGVQALLKDAREGRFNLVVAEALDRLSRNQADIAAIFNQLSFAGVRILTLAEGEISELHIGLKGTMNALFIKDLADKTRRGLSGRVLAGKSGGGNSYGYDVVKRFTADGEPIRGDRRINAQQAAIVTRIFTEYANGISPRAIAKQLNAEQVPAPAGKGWGPSTIHGNRQRGTGILNNELYIGRLVWNRLRYIKDPSTGKRVSRLNPEEQWLIREVPELRLIPQELWNRAKQRQIALDASDSGKFAPKFWDRKRPRYLLTGLMQCGCCGGGFVNFNKVYIGCANARNKGTCANKLTMRRADLEDTILNALQHRLMDERLTKIFCEEYARAMNRLHGQRSAQREGDRSRLSKIDQELDRLVRAIMDGVPASRVKEKMAELEAEKEKLEAKLSNELEDKIRIHPNMAGYYREKIATLRPALTNEERRPQAVEIIRQLIDRVTLTPDTAGKKLEIALEGHIAGILSFATNAKAPLDENDACVQVTKLVAGAGFEPATFRL